MATPTAQEILDKIDVAIAARLDGIIDGEVEEFRVRDKSFKEYSLEQLRGLRKEYQVLASAKKVGGMRFVAFRNTGGR